jgi:hypothetical protein
MEETVGFERLKKLLYETFNSTSNLNSIVNFIGFIVLLISVFCFIYGIIKIIRIWTRR